VAILGTGLVGGSVGLRLIRARPKVALVGFDRDPAVARRAKERGAVTEVAPTPQEAVAGADLVILAVPVDETEPALRAAALADRAVVTDVGSTKAAVVELGEALVGDRFVGGHPMAGSERHGIEAADAELFEDAWWILTPTSKTSSSAYRVVGDLVTSLGAKPIAVDPVAHDALVARLSHLPQLAASAVVAAAASQEGQESLLGLAAGGFRDVTRIAASHPDMWVSILRSNRDAVLEALGGLQGSLDTLRDAIDGRDWEGLRSFLEGTRRSRLELFAKHVHGGDPVALSLLIPDRPGVLAEVTTAAGELGVNIEDLQIFHSTEGGRGRLELVVAGEKAAGLLLERLRALGYHVEIGLPE
jgi:prephenate dehydrogenase